MKIIAEAGCNWRTMEEAKKFIDESKRLGLFATKFQIFNESNILQAPKEYQEFLRNIMLSKYDIHTLFEYGKTIEQEVFFTPMYPEIISFLYEIGVNYYKVRFKDRNKNHLKFRLSFTNKPIFISTDYSFFYSKEPYIPMFCIPEYPAKYGDYIEKTFDTITGKIWFKALSDHTPDLHLFRILGKHFEYWEKHVCLDKDCLEAQWSVTFEQLEEVLNHSQKETKES